MEIIIKTIKKEYSTTVSAIFSHYSTTVARTVLYRLEFTGLTFEIKCSFTLAGSGANNSGSGSKTLVHSPHKYLKSTRFTRDDISLLPLSLGLSVPTEDGANIGDEAQGVEDREEVEQGRVTGVVEPRLDGYRVI